MSSSVGAIECRGRSRSNNSRRQVRQRLFRARELARRGARVTGVDISSRTIEHAKQQELTGPLGIEYHVHDAATLPGGFDLRSFDMATSCLALQDMPNVEKVIQGVHALLRPGGRFVASIAHPCTDTPFRK
jgi:2-polyprenyl-3-methyl-5-hydroxy-6-metoxy-1,4-benzoquinol methylase